MSNRITLTNPHGTWFDLDSVTSWGPSPVGYILYRTRRGSWILHEGSNYTEVTGERAALWFINNNNELPEELVETAADIEI